MFGLILDVNLRTYQRILALLPSDGVRRELSVMQGIQIMYLQLVLISSYATVHLQLPSAYLEFSLAVRLNRAKL